MRLGGRCAQQARSGITNASTASAQPQPPRKRESASSSRRCRPAQRSAANPTAPRNRSGATAGSRTASEPRSGGESVTNASSASPANARLGVDKSALVLQPLHHDQRGVVLPGPAVPEAPGLLEDVIEDLLGR